MVEIGRVRVKAGNASIEQKISASPQADICAFVSTSLEPKRAARRPSQGSGRPKCKREGVAEDRLGQTRQFAVVRSMSALGVPAQPVDATQALNLSAGVSNCKVSRGRSFS